MLKLIEQRHQVTEIAPETIEGSNGDEIELPPLSIGHERIGPGRLSRVPLTAVSTYSATIVQPARSACSRSARSRFSAA